MRFIIIVLIITVIVSCSISKCDCIEASSDMIQTIYFNNFNQSDLDSIVLTSYNLNSNFTSLVNSYTIHGYKYDTLKFYAQMQPLNIKLDYKLNIVKTGQIFKITDFTTKRAKCCKSFFSESYFDELNSYTINGKKTASNAIEINN
jgi:hypothetical protein